jgi:hypothetical protein
MPVPMSHNKARDVPVEARDANEIVVLIRKLRWAGMHDEAEALEKELTRRGCTATDSVLAMSCETD